MTLTRRFVAPSTSGSSGGSTAPVLAPTPTVRETWTGTDGDAWPTTWTVADAGGGIDIQANRGRMRTGAVAYGLARAFYPGPKDGELLCKFQWATAGTERYQSAVARSTADGTNAMVLTQSHTSLWIGKRVSSSETVLHSVSHAPSADTWYWARFRWEGSSYRGRVWADGAAEPDDWMVSATDSTYASGMTGLFFVGGAHGTNLATLIDDYRMWTLSTRAATRSPYTIEPGWVQATTECPLIPTAYQQITGVLGRNWKKTHPITQPRVGAVRLLYVNYKGLEETTPNAIKVYASVLADDVESKPAVTFGGVDGVTIEPGGYALSDPVAVRQVQGGSITTYTFVELESTSEVIPCNYYTGEFDDRADTTQTDVRTSSEFSSAGSHNGYGPVAILGRNDSADKLVAFVGDSITYGYGDFPQHRGWAGRWAARDGVPHLNRGVPQDRAEWFRSLGYARNRLWQVDGATIAICGYGRNDGFSNGSVAALQANLQAIWDDLAHRVDRVYQATLTPSTTSTDSWATTANQTQSTTAYDVAKLTQINDWIRTLPAPLTGVIDVADATMSARNSGLWGVGLTGDGVHPNEDGHAAITAALPDLKTL